jgi:hypothetical protein
MLQIICSFLFLLLVSPSYAEEFKPNYTAKIESKELDFSFEGGLVQIRQDLTSKQSEVRCELNPVKKPEALFHFKGSYNKFRCEIVLAKELKVKIQGSGGQVQASLLTAETEIYLKNGQIQFSGNPSKNYDYDAVVENGMKPMLPMSMTTKSGPAIKVKLRMKNGMMAIQ